VLRKGKPLLPAPVKFLFSFNLHSEISEAT
jgi:hypothetical protein